ncbi:MAG: hypothetical protein HY819_03250 [Acidobacteria bacterium]|nr:hypothetical protein [Acidobacteriota bacterium]
MSTLKPESLNSDNPDNPNNSSNLNSLHNNQLEDSIKEKLTQEIKSIEYLLTEVPAWRANNLLQPNADKELFNFYGTRRYNLLQMLLPENKGQATNTDTASQVTTSIKHNTFVVKPAENFTNPSEDNLVLDPAFTENKVNNSSETLTKPLITAHIEVSRPISSQLNTSTSVNQGIPRQSRPYTAPPPISPTPPQKSLGELVSENINYIFAACGALFVGGIALYYRNELYHGLSQPIVQAAILMLITLAFLVSGISLVRQTDQTLLGRTLALVGSLLVPINPWFLVKSELIADTGRGWVLAIACTLLYTTLTYFLKDPLFVYLSLATGMITTWVGVYHFSNNVVYFSSYATALMAYSILALIAEGFFTAKEGDFTKERFGRPFFHFAQIGILLTLLFYTPLVALLPREFVATKMYFDSSYNSLLTVWLALAAMFAYSYSAKVRRASYFVYLSIAALYWSEISLFIYLKSSPGQAFLTISLTTLIISFLAKKLSLEEFYHKPIYLVSAIISYSSIGLAIIMLLAGVEISWFTILAFLVTAVIFQAGLQASLTQQKTISYEAAILYLSTFVLSLTKLTLDKDFLLLLFPLPTIITSILSYLAFKSKQEEKNVSWQNISIFCIGIAIYKLVQLSVNKDFSDIVLAIFWLEISLSLAAFSYLVKKEIPALVSAIFSTSILILSSKLFLDHFNLPIHKEALIFYAILALTYYVISQTNLLWKEIKQALSYLSNVLVVFLVIVSSVLILDNNPTTTTIARMFPVVLALFLIAGKESWHLWKAQNTLHSSLLGIIGIILLASVLYLVNIPSYKYLYLAEIILAIGYLLLACRLIQQKVNPQVSITFEVLANLIVVVGALGLIISGYNSSLDSFSSTTCLGYLVIVFFYLLATQLTEKADLIKVYSHSTFSLLLVTICLFAYNFGLHTWADLAAILIPVLIGFLFVDRLMENTKLSSASIGVAQVAQPIVVIFGIISGLSRNSPPISGTIFFAEISFFYLFLGLSRTKTYAIYLSVITSIISLFKLLDHFQVDFSYLTLFYGVYGLALFYIAGKTKDKWLSPIIYNSAHLILGLSATALTLQSFVSMASNNNQLTPCLISLIIMISIFSWVSITVEDKVIKNIYKNSAYVLGGVTYLAGGNWLGFSLISQTEFYSLPLALFILWNGYKTKADDSANFWLSFGAVLCVLPTLLHVMQCRFISNEPSAIYDFILIVVSLALMLLGILMQMKVVARISQAAFVTELAIIVFSAVNWEQQWLSILMILLAVGVFIAAWTIHNRYKNHQQAQKEAQNSRFSAR